MEKDIISTAVKILSQDLSSTVAQAVSNSLYETIVSKQFVIPTLGPGEKLVYTPDQVAELMGISTDSVYTNLLRKHGFPCIKVGNKFLIPAQAFHLWVNTQEVA